MTEVGIESNNLKVSKPRLRLRLPRPRPAPLSCTISESGLDGIRYAPRQPSILDTKKHNYYNLRGVKRERGWGEDNYHIYANASIQPIPAVACDASPSGYCAGQDTSQANALVIDPEIPKSCGWNKTRDDKFVSSKIKVSSWQIEHEDWEIPHWRFSSRMFDGCERTMWSAKTNTEEWVALDLSGAKVLTSIQWRPENDHAQRMPKGITIATGPTLDGPWTDVVSWAESWGASQKWVTHRFKKPICATFVRLFFDGVQKPSDSMGPFVSISKMRIVGASIFEELKSSNGQSGACRFANGGMPSDYKDYFDCNADCCERKCAASPDSMHGV